MSSKSDLRRIIINKRNELSFDYIQKSSLNVLNQLSKNKTFLESKFIGLYYPLSKEMDLRELINLYKDKRFAYPKVIKNEMIFIEVNKDTQFVKSNFNVYEPVTGIDVSNKLDLIIVPALSMNKDNYRLGFGKGYFDKFFKKYPNSYKIGIIYKDEEFDFDVEDHDVALDCYLMG